MKQILGKGYQTRHYSILLYFILSIAVVTNMHILLKFAPIMPASCSLLLPSYYSNNFSGKINASLFQRARTFTILIRYHLDSLESFMVGCIM